MSTIAENLKTLKSIKSDIQSAIIEKGGSASDSFASYAQAIRNLPSGGGGDYTLADEAWEHFFMLNGSVIVSNSKITELTTNRLSYVSVLNVPNCDYVNINLSTNYSIGLSFSDRVLIIDGCFYSAPNVYFLKIPSKAVLLSNVFSDSYYSRGFSSWNCPTKQWTLNRSSIFSLEHYGITSNMINKYFYQISIQPYSVTLPNAWYIGQYAFESCSKLKYLSAPELCWIDNCAFYDCSALSSISLSQCTHIGDYAFYSCSSNLSITLPSQIRWIGNSAFTPNEGSMTVYVSSINMPTCPKPLAFIGCNLPLLTHVTMGWRTAHFMTYSNQFSGASSTLQYISFSALESTSTDFFKGFKSLQEAYLPSCKIAGGGLFAQCDSLRIVDLQECTRMDGWVFEKCYSLSSVNLPNCQQISTEEFVSCWNLTKLSMPKLQTVNGYSNFAYCSKLSEVYMPLVRGLANCNFIYCSNLQKVTLSNRCAIGSYVFANCPSIDVTTLPKEMAIWDSTAFDADVMSKIPAENKIFAIPSYQASYNSGWYGMINKNISSTGTTYVSLPQAWFLGGLCFNNCTALKYIYAPNVEEITTSLFYQCYNLSSFDMPNIKNIESYAFMRCSALSTLSLSLCSSIGSHAFQNCSGLTSIDLPNSQYTSVAPFTFNGCTTLPSIELRYVTNIGPSAFGWNYLLSKVSIRTASTIQSGGFYKCSSLVDIYMPNLAYIASFAFDSCLILPSVSFSKCRYISNIAFRNCTSLSYIYIPMCSIIGDYAFQGCTALATVDLRSVTIVTSIYSYTFLNNPSLTSIYVPSSLLSSFQTADYWSSLSAYMIGV